MALVGSRGQSSHLVSFTLSDECNAQSNVTVEVGAEMVNREERGDKWEKYSDII